jgi:hypothetical protein
VLGIVGVKKELDGVTISIAAGQVAQLIAGDFLQPDAALRRIDMAAYGGEGLESGLGCRRPHLHALAIPAKQVLVGAKEDSLRGDQYLPNICEVALLGGNFVEQ